MVKKIIYVSACVIVDIDNKILVATREHKSDFKTYWEFPGGKLNKNETPEDCLIREIKEELDILVEGNEELIIIDHAYSHKKLQFHVYLCKLISGEPKTLASQQIKWVLPIDLSKYPFPSANIKIISALLTYLDK